MPFDSMVVSMTRTLPIKPRKGFALIEAMIAIGILTVAVTAVTSAIIAGQQQSIAAREKIVGTVAAESLMSQITAVDWDQLDFFNGFEETVGTITDPTGMIIEGDFKRIGRIATVQAAEVFIDPLEIYIVGKNVTVTSFDQEGNALSVIERFIPEPSS